MKKKIKLPLLLFVGGFSFSPLANENLSNFKHSSTDELKLESSSAPNVFKLQRTYQSRSLFRGLFGYGWCSELDRSLNVQQLEMIQYNDCSFDKPLRFKLSHTKSGIYIYRSLDNPQLSLIKMASGQYRLTDDSRIRIFADSGFMESYQDPQTAWSVDRTRLGLPYRIRTRFGSVKVRTDSDDRISSLRTKNSELLYSYNGGNLVSARSGGLASTYSYDRYHNMLTLIERNLQRRITYDPWLDAVTSVTDSGGCVQRRRIGPSDSLVTLNCGLGETRMTYDEYGRIVGLEKEGLGRALFSYSASSEIKFIKYKPHSKPERRYATSNLTDTARDTPELDTLLSLANQLAQAI